MTYIVNSSLNQQTQPSINTQGVQDQVVAQNLDNIAKFLKRLVQRKTPPAANVVIGPTLSSATYLFASGAIQKVSKLSVQIVTRGNPIAIRLVPAIVSVNSTYWSNVEVLSLTTGIASCAVGYYRNSVQQQPMSFNYQTSGTTNLKVSFGFPAFEIVDPQPSGVYTYEMYCILTDANSRLGFTQVALMAQELN